jgi:hypothetical protein
MSFDLSGYDRPEHTCCLTARNVSRHADLYALTYLCTDNRALVAHLLQETSDLMAASQTLSRIFLHDGYHAHKGQNSHDGDTACLTGLTEAQRLQVLTLASTCAYNATLFVQEAQRRRIRRVSTGWDPITTPVTT